MTTEGTSVDETELAAQLRTCGLVRTVSDRGYRRLDDSHSALLETLATILNATDAPPVDLNIEEALAELKGPRFFFVQIVKKYITDVISFTSIQESEIMSYKNAYGGVIFDPNGLVLLREPKNHFDGYVWTHPKGRIDPGETPEQTALREVKEETGANATVIAMLPGEYRGGTTTTRYFLMTAMAGTGGVPPDDMETASIKWMTPTEARQHIMQTTNAIGRKRDLAVLEAALLAREALFGTQSPG